MPLWAVRYFSVIRGTAERVKVITSFVLLLPRLLYGLKKYSFSHSLAVTVFAVSSKALAKNIWQGAGQIECLSFCCLCVVSLFGFGFF